MSKMLIFDMDGTIADLYGVENWLEKLRAEDVSPYQQAQPLFDMDSLNVILSIFKKAGYRISVVSWGSIGASPQYQKAIKKAKLQWLLDNNFPFDEVHVVKYGVPKAEYATANENILIDDNIEVINDFLTSRRHGSEKKAILAKDLMARLIDIMIEGF